MRKNNKNLLFAECHANIDSGKEGKDVRLYEGYQTFDQKHKYSEEYGNHTKAITRNRRVGSKNKNNANKSKHYDVPCGYVGK